MSLFSQFEASEAPSYTKRSRRAVGTAASGVLLSMLVGCGTNSMEASSLQAVENCNTIGGVKYNFQQQGSDTPVESVEKLKKEIRADVSILAKRTISKGGEISFNDGASLFTKSSSGTYSVSANETSLTLNFPKSDFHANELISFDLINTVTGPVESAAIVCSSKDGIIYPNGVVKLVDHMLTQTRGLEALNQ